MVPGGHDGLCSLHVLESVDSVPFDLLVNCRYRIPESGV